MGGVSTHRRGHPLPDKAGRGASAHLLGARCAVGARRASRLRGVVGVESGPERVERGHADSASSLTKHLRDRRPIGRFRQSISTVSSIAPDASALYHADIRAGRKIRARQEGGGSLRHFSIWSPISSYDAVDIRRVHPVCLLYTSRSAAMPPPPAPMRLMPAGRLGFSPAARLASFSPPYYRASRRLAGKPKP